MVRIRFPPAASPMRTGSTTGAWDPGRTHVRCRSGSDFSRRRAVQPLLPHVLAAAAEHRRDAENRVDLLAHLEGAGLIYGAVIFHFFRVPAAADAKQKATLRHLVQRSDELGGLYCVALDNEADEW